MADRKARYDRRQQARARREDQSNRALSTNRRAAIIKIAMGGVAVAVVAVVIVIFLGSRDILPPTGFGPNHSESLPPRQINTQPIPRVIQEHVMERGGGHIPGGMLVQYNCTDYECDPDLVERLTGIVRNYPQQVYLAPYPGMDAKIALAAPGRLVTLKTLDEAMVHQFITDNLQR